MRGTVLVVTGPEAARGVALFDGLPSGYGPIAWALRRTIRSVAPSPQERVKRNNPFWMGAQDVLCLQCFPVHVNLGVLSVAELTTLYPQLEGTGKMMPHVKVRSAAVARSPELKRVICAAAALDRGEWGAVLRPWRRRDHELSASRLPPAG